MVSPKIKLSIIIPAYNSSATILDTLNSLNESINSPFEVIIVDDCSTDNTSKIINDYILTHENIKLYCLPCNSGPGVARDEGLKHVTGEYTLYFDSDDLMRSGTVDRAITYLDKNNIDVAVFEYSVKFGHEKKDIGMWERDSQIYTKARAAFGDVFSPEQFPHFLTVTNYPWNKLCRTKFLRAHNISFGHLRLHEDILPHWLILMNAERLYLSPDIISDYVLDLNGSNVTNNKSELRLQCLEAANSLYLHLQNNPKYKPYFSEFWSFAACLLDWAKEVIETNHKQTLVNGAKDIFMKMTFADLQSIYHSDRNIHAMIYNFILNKKGF